MIQIINKLLQMTKSHKIITHLLQTLIYRKLNNYYAKHNTVMRIYPDYSDEI